MTALDRQGICCLYSVPVRSLAPSAQHQDQKPGDGSCAYRLRPWQSWFIVIFACCHAVKLLAGLLPEESRPDLLPGGLSHAYETLTGSRQNWNMFATIPSHHHYAARIVIQGTDGQEREEGPLLPGLMPWPEPEVVRYYNFFERMLSGSMGDEVRDEVRDAYLLKMDEALRAEGKIREGERWSLEVTEDFTRTLAFIQKDGRVFERRLQRFSVSPQTPAAAAP